MEVESGAIVKVTFEVFDDDGDNCETIQLELDVTLTCIEFLSKLQAEVYPTAKFSNMMCIGVFKDMHDFTNSLAEWIKLHDDIEWSDGGFEIQIGHDDIVE